ncbi:MAG: UvrD-helicase domain-containing protein [Saprospiraceae bacterium]|nr:UvrD-helicase domain-containing protein [Saprospiraceae bacterium]
MDNLKIISAGAGSGKTYRLTHEMVGLLQSGVRPSGIIATTFTKKAAAELQERVRVSLLEEGMTEAADELTNALIGTVHGLGVKLLRRFAFEAGVSPQVDIIADEDHQVMFNQSLATVLTEERVQTMEHLSDRLGLNKRDFYDWRKEVRMLTEVARSNNFSEEVLQKSKERSFESFKAFLGVESDKEASYFLQTLEQKLNEAIDAVDQNEDSTKKTAAALQTLKAIHRDLRLRGNIYWYEWVKIAKIGVGAKSREDVADLVDFARTHNTHPDFHKDIKAFIDQLFDIAIEALKEYQQYKNSRGLIDYTDMEVLINELLDKEAVKQILQEELDLLMVDEFQDTSPIQLEIFLKLSAFANYSVWVGDPKQSIYGFRGAEPRLMQAIIQQIGIRPADIQEYSWRSREDIVFATNALFTKAFADLPKEQIALKPKRCKQTGPDCQNKVSEPIEMGDALVHWHFQVDGEGRPPGKPWMENAIANSLKAWLDRGVLIQPKGSKDYRKARLGDVAILCRSNSACQLMAEALHRAGIKAAIARNGLLQTAEAKLILACLKYILHPEDSLSVAEILLLAAEMPIEAIIEHRLDYLKEKEGQKHPALWASEKDLISKLDLLRGKVEELSGAEILNVVLQELDLRRLIVGWGKTAQRLDNVDVLRRLALQYEEACNRLHSAASLGGLLLWLNDLENDQKDAQGSGEGPDAVQILTYHKSKGLEWPVVICHSLEGPLRADVWGMEIVAESEEVDLTNVLGNRWLRYWVNPYADQIRRTQLEERIAESQAQKEQTEMALQEEARLLYVGITRARDYLVIPTGPKPTRWLNRVWHNGQGDFPTLEEATFESPWAWEGHYLNKETETFIYPRAFPTAELAEADIRFVEPAAGKAEHLVFRIDLKKDTPPSVDQQGRVVARHAYLKELRLLDDFDKYSLAKAIKAFHTADRLTYELELRQQMAEGIIDRFEVSEMIDVEGLVHAGSKWRNFVQHHFPAKREFRKYPIRHYHNGQLFETIVDLLLETDEGWVMIQNSSYAGSDKNLDKKAIELASWFYLVREALASIFATTSVRPFVHFVLSADCFELEGASIPTQ